MKRLLFALALTAATFALPQGSDAIPLDPCRNDCNIVCNEPGATWETYCIDRCGTWAKTTCGGFTADGTCACY